MIESSQRVAQTECKLIAVLRAEIAEMERRIEEITVQHPDFPIFDSLPGAGQALVPRLIAAFGSRRERFASAAEVQNCVGISPVRESSGRTTFTHFRRACPKFVRQTFHEWAGHSIVKSTWAREYYDQQIAKGKKHHAAVRALAYKWIRVVFPCWRDHQPYDEERYAKRLEERRPPKSAGGPGPAPVDFEWKSLAGFFKFSRVGS